MLCFWAKILSVSVSQSNSVQPPVVVWIKAHGVLSHCQECRLVSFSALMSSDWDWHFPVWPFALSFHVSRSSISLCTNACTERAKCGNVKKCFDFKLVHPKWTFWHYLLTLRLFQIFFSSYHLLHWRVTFEIDHCWWHIIWVLQHRGRLLVSFPFNTVPSIIEANIFNIDTSKTAR